VAKKGISEGVLRVFLHGKRDWASGQTSGWWWRTSSWTWYRLHIDYTTAIAAPSTYRRTDSDPVDTPFHMFPLTAEKNEKNVKTGRKLERTSYFRFCSLQLKKQIERSQMFTFVLSISKIHVKS